MHDWDNTTAAAALSGVIALWEGTPPAHLRSLSPSFAAAVLPAIHGENTGHSTLRHHARLLLKDIFGASDRVGEDGRSSGAGASAASRADLALVLPRPQHLKGGSIDWPMKLDSEQTPDRLLRFALQLRQGEEEIVLVAL